MATILNAGKISISYMNGKFRNTNNEIPHVLDNKEVGSLRGHLGSWEDCKCHRSNGNNLIRSYKIEYHQMVSVCRFVVQCWVYVLC